MNLLSDYFNIVNLEKVLLALLLFVVVVIASIKYFLVGDISNNWVNIITILGGLFIGRKAFSYFKKDSYNNVTTQETQTIQETQISESTTTGNTKGSV